MSANPAPVATASPAEPNGPPGVARSRYLVMGDHLYRRPDGTAVRVGYLSRKARLFSVDAATAAALERDEIDEIRPAARRELERLGALVPRPAAELGEMLAHLRAGSDSRRRRRFTIMPTAYCNMGCAYCGQEHDKTRPSRDLASRMADRVVAVIGDPLTETVSVTWFGGEPLLAYRTIAEMSERFVAKAAESGTAYFARMATNGSLITVRRMVELHERFALRYVDITIDGPRDVHDARRILKSGGRSFDRCVGVLAELAASGAAPGLHINIRVNVDVENQDRIPELLAQLAAAGLNTGRFSIGFMPVHTWGNDVSAVELEARAYARREIEWVRRADQLGFRTAGLPSEPIQTTCIATTRSGEIHDPSGNVYSCSEHPLVPGVRKTGVIGRTTELAGTARRTPGMYDDWYDQVADDAQTCHRCPFLPVCGGSCPKLWREGHLPCPSYKFNAQERIDMAATGRLGLLRDGTGHTVSPGGTR